MYKKVLALITFFIFSVHKIHVASAALEDVACKQRADNGKYKQALVNMINDTHKADDTVISAIQTDFNATTGRYNVNYFLYSCDGGRAQDSAGLVKRFWGHDAIRRVTAGYDDKRVENFVPVSQEEGLRYLKRQEHREKAWMKGRRHKIDPEIIARLKDMQAYRWYTFTGEVSQVGLAVRRQAKNAMSEDVSF